MLQAKLQNYINELKFEVPASVQLQMLEFLAMLAKWNQSFNLTAITDPYQMLTHHLMDSLVVAPFIQGSRILDVGTGAGLPGIPLSLLYPDKQFTLLDSNGKKIRFLVQVKAKFQLMNVQTVQTRVENYQTTPCFDDIICRAVGAAPEIINQSKHLLSPNGRWLFMKGAVPQLELDKIKQTYVMHALQVPGLAAARHLIVVHNQES